MKHIAAYLLAQLGGKANPSAKVPATPARPLWRPPRARRGQMGAASRDGGARGPFRSLHMSLNPIMHT